MAPKQQPPARREAKLRLGHRPRPHEIAAAVHDAHRQDQSETFKAVLEFGQSAIRAALTLNGGAAVATLAFIGALISSPRILKTDYAPLVDVLITYGAGLAFSAVAAAAAYCAQYAFFEDGKAWILTWDHPYLEATQASRRYQVIGATFHIMAILIVLASYLEFLIGGWKFATFARSALHLLAPTMSNPHLG